MYSPFSFVLVDLRLTQSELALDAIADHSVPVRNNTKAGFFQLINECRSFLYIFSLIADTCLSIPKILLSTDFPTIAWGASELLTSAWGLPSLFYLLFEKWFLLYPQSVGSCFMLLFNHLVFMITLMAKHKQLLEYYLTWDTAQVTNSFSLLGSVWSFSTDRLASQTP